MSTEPNLSPVKHQRTSLLGRLLHSTPTSLRTSARSNVRSLNTFHEEPETVIQCVSSQDQTSLSHDALVQVLRSFASTVHQAAEVFDSVDSSFRQTHARIDKLSDRFHVISERIQHAHECRHCMRILVLFRNNYSYYFDKSIRLSCLNRIHLLSHRILLKTRRLLLCNRNF